MSICKLLHELLWPGPGNNCNPYLVHYSFQLI